jgi:hypothetical protein
MTGPTNGLGRHLKICEQTICRLAPGESNKLHTKADGPKKNARRNPKKKQS